MNEGLIQNQSLPNGLRVVRALPADTEDVMALLHNTARWLHEQGSTQWNHCLRDKTLTRLQTQF
ncbi:hypothetical protein [Paenibacillus sp. KS1]|uniref:hypothetical protein n=1 Tax=Paenibacillus sp. KS1 TaxID=1849249 RepID=UPI0020C79A91|nr:hypothetical protein [Paenibacillus sp. KS1]